MIQNLHLQVFELVSFMNKILPGHCSSYGQGITRTHLPCVFFFLSFFLSHLKLLIIGYLKRKDCLKFQMTQLHHMLQLIYSAPFKPQSIGTQIHTAPTQTSI